MGTVRKLIYATINKTIVIYSNVQTEVVSFKNGYFSEAEDTGYNITDQVRNRFKSVNKPMNSQEYIDTLNGTEQSVMAGSANFVKFVVRQTLNCGRRTNP